MQEHPLNKKKKSPKLDVLYSLFLITIGSVLLSVALAMFINPIGMYAAGVTGFAQIFLRTFSLIFNNNINSFDKYLGIMNFILLLPFDIFAYFKLSKKYGLYSLYSSVVQTIVLEFSDFFLSLNVFNNNGTYDVFSCVFLAGTISGLANAIMYKRGATSGGFSIIYQYLSLKKNKSVGNLNFVISSIILFFGALIVFIDCDNKIALSQALSVALYTLMMFIISSIVLDYTHTSYNKIKLEIVTEKGEEVIKTLMEHTPHGVTISKAVGGYTKREKTVIFIIISSYEQLGYINIIKSVDDKAFITSTPVSSFSGNFKIQIINK